MYVVTIGTFDGVHKGHQYILNKTKDLAEKLHAKPLAVILKYPSPKYHGNFDGLILSSWQRKKIIENMGIETEIINMEDVWHITHPEYLKILLKRGVKGIVCGKDFTFGKDRAGNIDYLQSEGRRHGLVVEVLSDQIEEGSRVSSTIIRRALKNGKIKLANELLTRNWTIEGTVYEDRHIGMTLGFPTANTDIREKEEILIPKFGVYLVKGYVEGFSNSLWGLMNVGMRPTNDPNLKAPKVETYFLDFFGDLYGKNLVIEVIEYLREEVKFSSEQVLISQMITDEDNARKIIKNYTNGTL